MEGKKILFEDLKKNKQTNKKTLALSFCAVSNSINVSDMYAPERGHKSTHLF